MESTAIRPIPPLPGLTRAGLTGALLAFAAGAWVVTGERMEGMDGGPGTALGGPGTTSPRIEPRPWEPSCLDVVLATLDVLRQPRYASCLIEHHLAQAVKAPVPGACLSQVLGCVLQRPARPVRALGCTVNAPSIYRHPIPSHTKVSTALDFGAGHRQPSSPPL